MTANPRRWRDAPQDAPPGASELLRAARRPAPLDAAARARLLTKLAAPTASAPPAALATAGLMPKALVAVVSLCAALASVSLRRGGPPPAMPSAVHHVPAASAPVAAAVAPAPVADPAPVAVGSPPPAPPPVANASPDVAARRHSTAAMPRPRRLPAPSPAPAAATSATPEAATAPALPTTEPPSPIAPAPESPTPTASAPTAPTEPPTPAGAQAVAVATPASAQAAVEAPNAAPPAVVPDAGARPDNPLAREVAAIAAIRLAVERDPRLARRRIAAYDRQHPQGQLREERDAFAFEVARRLDPAPVALRLGERFLREHPDSGHVDSIREELEELR